MTIKEIESQAGMERANIRFYEREGLIVPIRMENGYRDYSEDDFQILLRIKLLRSLHISLDEIKALIDGSKNLVDTLTVQITKLEQEKKDVSYAQDVCRSIQEGHVAFSDLDAKKYLDGITLIARETGSSYFSVEGDEFPQVFNPWRRFLARMFDLILYRIFWSVFLAFVLDVSLITRSNLANIVDTLIATAIMLFIEPLLLRFTGTTPGKAILGLTVKAHDGRNLSYGEGFERTRGVIGSGMGYNIPVYNIVRLWKSYKVCNANETLPWDESISYTLKDTKWARSVLYIVANAVLIFVILLIFSAQIIPPNRGNLTVSEFAENHNYYAKHQGVDLGNKYLDENGEWAEKEFDGTAYIEIGQAEKPEYQFTIENGYITEVSFTVEIINSDAWITSYSTQMFLSSFAFAGARNEVKIFSSIPKRISSYIAQNTFNDFQFIEAGITFTNDIEYSGYNEAASQFLIPDENASETYFRQKFSMIKQK